MSLTILFLTANRLPKKWSEFHKQKLLESAGDYPIISLSRKETGVGLWVPQTEPISKANIFWQMLKGSKVADTEYIAIAEDDCLYSKEHFDYRPVTFGYNMNRWSLYTWGDPIYHMKYFLKTNATFIGKREDTIKALEERFSKYPLDYTPMPVAMSGEIGSGIESVLGITPVRAQEFKTPDPCVQLDHDFFTVFNPRRESVEKRHRKKLADIRAYDIPVWGHAKKLVEQFHE